MLGALSIQKYLALNKGRYMREVVKLPYSQGCVYVTTHHETAATDLLHYHETTHFSFVLNGGVVDRRRNSESEIRSGQLMFFHAGEPHESIYKGFPVKNINIELEPNFFSDNAVSESNFRSSIEQNANTKCIILKIFRELLTGDQFSNCSIDMLLLSLLDDKSKKADAYPKWLQDVLELINDNWNDDISLDDLATVAQVHPKTISKYFPKYFACTLGEYRRRIKVEKALTLIKTSDLTLTEIAHHCGFFDQSHFTATFKNLTGFRPREFQKT